MKKIKKSIPLAILAAGLIILLSPFAVKAQEETTPAPVKTNPIVEMLEEESSVIEFDIPDDILNNLVTAPGSLKRPGTGGTKNANAGTNKKKPTVGTPGRIDGYRIQVFSDGRNPATLQTRAKARGNAIVARFPKYRGQVYSFSSSPNWYTRVGNFKTQEEASAALAELKRAFPNFAAEMRVVKSPITGYQGK